MISTAYDPTRKSPQERLLHALIFELMATLICAPVMSWSTGKSLLHTGSMTLVFAAIAMLWNMLFNLLFDRAQRRLGFQRTPGIRLLHASLFEIGLTVTLVPVAAWWLEVSLLKAFVLDIGLVLFFLPYTVAFNWIYDVLRERLVRRRLQSAPTMVG